MNSTFTPTEDVLTFHKEATSYWDTVGLTKDCEGPFFAEEFLKGLSQDSRILDYGCGYGRLMNLLVQEGFRNSVGIDISKKMLEKGKVLFPQLDLHPFDSFPLLPFPDDTFDAILMVKVLCWIPSLQIRELILKDISLALKKEGRVYLHDFLVTSNDYYEEKYQQGYRKYHDFGTYDSSDGVPVKHSTRDEFLELLKLFSCQWTQEIDSRTINNNPIRALHGIFQLKEKNKK